MTTIDELISSRDRWPYEQRVDIDSPLENPSLLQGCQIARIRLMPIARRLDILFDMRGTLHYTNVNTCLVVADGVGSVSWTDTWDRSRFRAAYVAGGRRAELPDGVNEIWFESDPDGRLGFSARAIRVVVGTVESVNEPEPDLTEVGETEVEVGYPDWSMNVVPSWGASLSAGPL